ncbi:MAG: hypothetical protein K2X36_10330 [Microbacteriaceae bacterium]|nr:hypothetical protein [Microbacteriaceae bacterium]
MSTALRNARAVQRRRAGAPTGETTRYTGYLTIMVTLIIVVPLGRAAAIALGEPAALTLMLSPAAGVVVAAALGMMLAALILLGQVRGPALLSPFATVAIAGNGLPRSVTLRRPLVIAALILAGLLGGAAAFVGAIMYGSSVTTIGAAGTFVGGVLLYAAVAAGGWLVGQVASRPIAQLAAAAVALATVATVLIPPFFVVAPWGWAAALYPPIAGIEWLPLGGLALLACLAVALSPRLLDRLKGPDLLSQARRWQAVGTFGAVGDLAGAFAQFRPLPTRGRGRWAVRGRGLATTFLYRDLVGALRTPGRCVVAVAAVIGAGLLNALAFTAPSGAMAAGIAVAAVLGYLGLGVWSDGLRHAAESAGSPTLYGVGHVRLVVLHALFPTAAAILFAAVGATAGFLLGASWSAVLLALLAAAFTVAVRILDATKGQMPLSLLAPIPSPAGDLSGVLIAYWQADSLIITVIVLTGVALLATANPLALLLLVATGVIVLLLARRRLGRR